MRGLRLFTEEFREVELAVGVSDRTVDLVAEGIDCVSRIGDLLNSSMVSRQIGTAIMVTYASAHYVSAHGALLTPQDLAGNQCVSFLYGQTNKPRPRHFSQNGEDRLHMPQGGITVNDSNAYVQCAVADFRIIQAPGISVETFLASAQLVEVLEAYRPKPRMVSVLYPSRTHLAPLVDAFVVLIQNGPTLAKLASALTHYLAMDVTPLPLGSDTGSGTPCSTLIA